jgi:energy-coupling factor transporter ATP-binding protein EcfA2
MIRRIVGESFEPFGEFKLTLPTPDPVDPKLAEVHLFTGINGTGKTRILSLVAGLLGNPEPLRKRLKGKKDSVLFSCSMSDSDGRNPAEWNDRFIANEGSAQWNQMHAAGQWSQKVPALAYSGNTYIQDTTISIMAGVGIPDRVTCLNFNRATDQSSTLAQSIANLAIQTGTENANRARKAAEPMRATGILRKIESTISEITGREFYFNVNPHPKPVLEVYWGEVGMGFDTLPDGLRSIIGWLVHAVVTTEAIIQGKGDPTTQEVVFLLDEIECHLHPAWQRRVLPAFQKLFPNGKILIATHSPFVISSLNHGWIHKLKPSSAGRVEIEKPLRAKEGDSYISAVEDILGVKEWYDLDTEKQLSDFRGFRDKALTGDVASLQSAVDLAEKISLKGIELKYIIGAEMKQLQGLLSKPNTPS